MKKNTTHALLAASGRSPAPAPLPRSFYNRSTLTIARELLGTYVVRAQDARTTVARIVDVEAYIGPHDKACHASKGRTKRTDVMFGPAGYIYVYLIYGMYHCLNIVTERVDFPAAILIRGIEVLEHTDDTHGPTRRIDGPGRLCRELGIDRSLNGCDATAGEQLWIEDRGDRVPRRHIQALPRVGIDYAGPWAEKPWRLCIPQRPSSTTATRARPNTPKTNRRLGLKKS